MLDGVTSPRKRVETRDTVVIRFAGDSGDGMQVTGMQFTTESALAGNDLATLPDFPAEIRAPAGTLAGVSAFQLNFSSNEVFTPGDDLDVLVAMNPAALKMNVGDLKSGGILIVDREGFNEQNLKKAEYESNPLADGSLDRYQLFRAEVTRLTTAALKDLGLSARSVFRCRNFFCLGMTSWLYHRPIEPAEAWIKERFKKTPELVEANVRALRAGHNFAENAELFAVSYEIRPARIAPGKYRNITGNTATALGFVCAATKAGRPLFLGSYPITPASDVLHELSGWKQYGVYTFQAEDEIAGIGAALGAAFGGAIAITTTSGPGMNLKAEIVGLALADCFRMAFEAVRIAVKYMTPVVLLTDGYLANGAEPWLIPDPATLPEVPVAFRTEASGFFPYLRDEETLSRPWVVPGTPGLEHRIGGLEKEYLTGNVSYAPTNHEQMIRVRARKIAGIIREIPPLEVFGPLEGELLVVGWGSTYGSITQAVRELQAAGHAVAHVHLRHLNPLPADLGGILRRYRRVLVPEMNLGQLVRLIRAEYLVDAIGFNKIQGRPFKVSEIVSRCLKLLAKESLA